MAAKMKMMNILICWPILNDKFLSTFLFVYSFPLFGVCAISNECGNYQQPHQILVTDLSLFPLKPNKINTFHLLYRQIIAYFT